MNHVIAIPNLKAKLTELFWSLFCGVIFGAGLAFGFWLVS